ncbi:hypothetical protein BDW66DRAFT_18834 [Aspergillus desertorum]
MEEPTRWQPCSEALLPTSHRTTSQCVCNLRCFEVYPLHILIQSVGLLTSISFCTLDIYLIPSVRPLTAARRRTTKSKDDERQTPRFLCSRERKMLVSCAIHFTPFDTPEFPSPYCTYLLGYSPVLDPVILPSCLFDLFPESSPRPLPPVFSPSLLFWRSSSSMKQPACCSRLVAGSLET